MTAQRTPPITRVERRCVYEDRGYTTPCRIFKGSLSHGYGQVNAGGRRPAFAHRVTYEHYVGPIAEGLELDHLCRQPACCEVSHLEAVTHRENMRRGLYGSKTHCKHGHEFDQANTRIRRDGTRDCRACHRRQESERKERLRAP